LIIFRIIFPDKNYPMSVLKPKLQNPKSKTKNENN